MSYELFSSHEKTLQCIFLDNDVFRRLIKDSQFWNNFLQFFEKEYPEAFHDIEFIFTWSQVLEAINYGTILAKINENDLWLECIKKFQSDDIYAINCSLDRCCQAVLKIIENDPRLQKNSFEQSIDKAIAYYKKNPHAYTLVESTLIKARNFVISGDYMKDLSREIAWAFLCSYDFISPNSSRQYESRKLYLDALLSLWHKFYKQGHELELYSLLDKRYNVHISHSEELEMPELDFKLKPGSDLCDGQMINYAALGIKGNKKNTRYRVISIAMTTKKVEQKIKEKYEYRISVAKQKLIEIERDAIGWKAAVTPGEILILTVNMSDNYKITGGHKISFDTPFKK